MRRYVTLVIVSLFSLIAPFVSVGGSSASRPAGSLQADVGSSAAAAARAPDQVVSNRYSSYRMVWIGRFNLCLGVWVHGKMKADMYFTPIEGGAYATMTNPRVVNPHMQVTMKKSCDDSASVKRRHQANMFNFRNYFYGYKCSYDPSFSVSIPWSVGVGITPDCGSERVAKYGDTNKHASRAYRFLLDTDGYAFSWDQHKTNTQPTNLTMCSSVSTYFTLKDTKGATRKKVLKKAAAADACVYYRHPF